MSEFTMEIGGLSKADLLALNRPALRVGNGVKQLMSQSAFKTGTRQPVRIALVRFGTLESKAPFTIANVLQQLQEKGQRPFLPDAGFYLLEAPINLKEKVALIHMAPFVDDTGAPVIFYIRESYGGMRYLEVISTSSYTPGIDGIFCIREREEAENVQ